MAGYLAVQWRVQTKAPACANTRGKATTEKEWLHAKQYHAVLVTGREDRHMLWRAQVRHNGKLISAGSFRTVEEAEAAVVALRIELFTHNDKDRKAA